jgi:hypothetical protein
MKVVVGDALSGWAGPACCSLLELQVYKPICNKLMSPKLFTWYNIFFLFIKKTNEVACMTRGDRTVNKGVWASHPSAGGWSRGPRPPFGFVLFLFLTFDLIKPKHYYFLMWH